jgi:ubiquinone biosynthesis protein
MNALRFLRLLRILHGRNAPDIELIQRMGLLAVKIGQVYALRPDFLPAESCRALSRLYSQTNALPAEDSIRLIERVAVPGFLDHFARFERTPFASASIGQAHRGTLLTGESVVVKLVKQDAAAEFRRDVRSVRRLFRMAILFYPKLRGVANPVSLLHEIEKMTLCELDLRNEAKGRAELRSIAEAASGRFDLSHLRFQRTFEALSNRDVLVSEYVDGPTLDQLLARRELGYDALLELFHLHGYFMFSVGTFHGDIHPGNIVLKDGNFYFLDTGYIGRVKEHMRVNLFRFFAALSAYDFPASAAALNQMAERPIDGRAYARFEQRFLKLYADFAGKTVSEVSLTRQMMLTIRLGVVSGMLFDEGMFDIIKSLMYLDGMVLRANPQAVLLEDMRRYIAEFNPLVA